MKTDRATDPFPVKVSTEKIFNSIKFSPLKGLIKKFYDMSKKGKLQ